MERTKFSSDRGTISLEITPQVRDCSCCANRGKCGTETPQEDLHATLFPKPRDRATREQHRPLREALKLQQADNRTMPDVCAFSRKPVIEKEAEPSSDLSDAAQKLISDSQETRALTLQMSLAPVETEEDQGPSSELVIEKAKAIRRGFDTQNLIREAVIGRAKATHADKLVAESREHQARMAAERRAEFQTKHPSTKKQ